MSAGKNKCGIKASEKGERALHEMKLGKLFSRMRDSTGTAA